MRKKDNRRQRSPKHQNRDQNQLTERSAPRLNDTVNPASLATLTLNDYANNKRPTNRPNKHLRAPVRRIAAVHREEDDEHAEDENDDAIFPDPASSKPTDKSHTNASEPLAAFISYPDDCWFAIGRHIAAPDIGRFAAINRQTARVTRSASFWQHVYRREYASAAGDQLDMPDELRPDCVLGRLAGQRTATIRMLFHCNAELRRRLRQSEAASSPFDLIGRDCVAVWSMDDELPGAGRWHCFRLRRRHLGSDRLRQSERTQRDRVFAQMYRDIYRNADESCALLCVRFGSDVRVGSAMPNLFGPPIWLQRVQHTLSGRGCAAYRLALEFYSGGATSSEIAAEPVYDPVLETRVHSWWSPRYAEMVRRGEESDECADDGEDGAFHAW